MWVGNFLSFFFPFPLFLRATLLDTMSAILSWLLLSLSNPSNVRCHHHYWELLFISANMNLNNEGEASLSFSTYLERREISSLFSKDLGAVRQGRRREKSRHPLLPEKTKKRMEERKTCQTHVWSLNKIIKLI